MIVPTFARCKKIFECRMNSRQILHEFNHSRVTFGTGVDTSAPKAGLYHMRRVKSDRNDIGGFKQSGSSLRRHIGIVSASMLKGIAGFWRSRNKSRHPVNEAHFL